MHDDFLPLYCHRAGMNGRRERRARCTSFLPAYRKISCAPLPSTCARDGQPTVSLCWHTVAVHMCIPAVIFRLTLPAPCLFIHFRLFGFLVHIFFFCLFCFWHSFYFLHTAQYFRPALRLGQPFSLCFFFMPAMFTLFGRRRKKDHGWACVLLSAIFACLFHLGHVSHSSVREEQCFLPCTYHQQNSLTHALTFDSIFHLSIYF